ncbi:MAG TPA: sugar phosphate nucleotidyltransferase, partial [Candidatus Woesebacteria bacterium]|nr:sugar phosphate nucleotidyltransferase [Candidatus Woesebacteria bacterium]
MKPVIICGGIGTKMWPLSCWKMPKQFLPLINGKSLFQLNWEALRLKFKPNEIYLQTNKEQAVIANNQISEIIDENIFIEPEMKNQGPATGFAAAMLYRQFPDEPFMLVQADVLRQPTEKFLEMIDQFDNLIRQKGKIVTGGMKPKEAVMGVDYLKINKTTRQMEEWLGRGEKEQIESYLTTGDVLIHTNHYAWTPRLMLDLFKRRKPAWYQPLVNIINGGNIAVEYAKMPSGPIEEITKEELLNGYIIELPFDWVDFGTWESVADYLVRNGLWQKDSNILEIEGQNNFIKTPSGKKVAIIGLNDLVVIDNGEALLITTKNNSGKVSEAAAYFNST